MHRWVVEGDEPRRLYCFETSSHMAPPHRYLSKHGQFLESAPYCERDQRGPTEPLLADGTAVEVYARHHGSSPTDPRGSVMVMATHPFDVVGGDGGLYPWAMSVGDFEPLTGWVHQPPPVHQVLKAAGMVVGLFVPRKVDYHPLSVPVPYHHSNVDSNEVMFCVGGDDEARRGSGIGLGPVSLHPGGHTHGPQPGAAETSLGRESFDETALMLDTFRPREIGAAGRQADDGRYAWSWSGRGSV